MEILALASRPCGILHLLAFYGVSETQHEPARVNVPEAVARVVRLLSKSRSTESRLCGKFSLELPEERPSCQSAAVDFHDENLRRTHNIDREISGLIQRIAKIQSERASFR